MGAVQDIHTKHKPGQFGIRHVQVLMISLSMMICFAMRANMSIAIVAMTDQSQEEYFDWSIHTQGIILSSFNWAYVVLMIPGGELASRFGAKILLTICVAVNSVVVLALPSFAHVGGWQLVCFGRIIQGISQGLVVPCSTHLISKWAPVEEKSIFTSLIFGSGQLGTAVQLFISGYIADYWGWPGIFYINGLFGGFWTIIYIFIGANSPEESRMISSEERLFIQTSLGQIGGHKKLKTPWRDLLTSVPFMAIIIAATGFCWGFWTLLTEIPTYMSKVLGVNIKSNGTMSALPYLAMFLTGVLFGYISDYILKKNWLTVTTTRKLFNTIGFAGPGVALIILGNVPAERITIAFILLVITLALNAGFYTGYLLVPLDMAPNFAGTIIGIANGISNMISMMAPIVVGFILEDETDAREWQLVFYIAAGVLILSNFIFIVFGTSKRQKWNDVEIKVVV